tara:strand:- start:590 stop:790 length:201 start_codon:yes stop_codon:yes gene_type:complete
MSNEEFRQLIKKESERIIESLLYQSPEEDYEEDKKYLHSSQRTFKELCECNGENYKDVIQELKEKA